MNAFVTITMPEDRYRAIDQELAQFPGEADKVLAKAINDAAAAGQKQTIASILAAVAIDNTKVVKSRVVRTGGRATPQKLSAQIDIKGSPISLASFKTRFIRPHGNGVELQIMRGRVIRLPHAFMGVGPRGKMHVMELGPERKRMLLVHYQPNKGRIKRVPVSTRGIDLVSIIASHDEIMQRPFEVIGETLLRSSADGIDRVLKKNHAF